MDKPPAHSSSHPPANIWSTGTATSLPTSLMPNLNLPHHLGHHLSSNMLTPTIFPTSPRQYAQQPSAAAVPVSVSGAQPLPPILPNKRSYDDAANWVQQKARARTTAPQQVTGGISHHLQPPLHSMGRRRYDFGDDKHFAAPRRQPSSTDSFVLAADMGARAQSAVDSAAGDVFETYELGKTIVSSSKLYANQRRSNRLLPGGGDSTTAACYMIGGTPDSVLSPLLSRVSPCDPREERCKAVERVLKDKTRGAICALNGENPREARADNLAAVRICEVVADVLVAYTSRQLMESRKGLINTVQRQEQELKTLREEVQNERERRKREGECWCKGQNVGQVGTSVGMGVGVSGVDMNVGGGFEREKTGGGRRDVLEGGRGERSVDSERGSEEKGE